MGQPGRLRTALLTFAAMLVLAFVVGFVAFANSISRLEIPDGAAADGIVVLTGGSARIDSAIGLLADGRAQRLLITGVNPTVDTKALSEALEADLTGPLGCCIDLDHKARDTIGNAVESRDWAEENGFGSLILVTSVYHMPRSLAEFSAAMPGLVLTAFPVRNPELNLDSWWRDPEAFGILAREYPKFVLTWLRLALTPEVR